jgi:DNA invertase Pin-like site-specific DNA recombinase
MSFARVRGLASERLSAVQTKGVLVVEKVSRLSRGSSELGGMSVGVRVVG